MCLSVASAQDPKDQCDLPNCTRPKAVEANGYKYNYCCRDHALKDGEDETISARMHMYVYICYAHTSNLCKPPTLDHVYIASTK